MDSGLRDLKFTLIHSFCNRKVLLTIEDVIKAFFAIIDADETNTGGLLEAEFGLEWVFLVLSDMCYDSINRLEHWVSNLVLTLKLWSYA